MEPSKELSARIESVPEVKPMTYDLAIIGGRVIDPESGLDAIRNVGVNGGRIETLTDSPLDGNAVIDADGLVVAPGSLICTRTARTQRTTKYRRGTVLPPRWNLK